MRAESSYPELQPARRSGPDTVEAIRKRFARTGKVQQLFSTGVSPLLTSVGILLLALHLVELLALLDALSARWQKFLHFFLLASWLILILIFGHGDKIQWWNFNFKLSPESRDKLNGGIRKLL